MFSSDRESIKERIKDFRKSTKLKQPQVAEYLGLTRTAYVGREKDGNFTWDHFLLLAELFDTTPFILKYGLDDDALRGIAKSMRNNNRLQQPTFTIFDDFDDKIAQISNYSNFLSLEDSEQNLIISYIEENDL